MIEKIIEIIEKDKKLVELNSDSYKNMKAGPAKFSARYFDAEGLGRVSILSGTGMMGLMKTDTVIINPFERDMPLLSYDRIQVFGKDIFLLEMYDTRLNKGESYDSLMEICKEYPEIPENVAKPCWYDSIKLKEYIRKTGSKKDTAKLNELLEKFIAEYMVILNKADICFKEDKKKEAAKYTDGLLENGGPSTDQFIKSKGKEFTTKLFKEVLFGTDI